MSSFNYVITPCRYLTDDQKRLTKIVVCSGNFFYSKTKLSWYKTFNTNNPGNPRNLRDYTHKTIVKGETEKPNDTRKYSDLLTLPILNNEQLYMDIETKEFWLIRDEKN